MWNPGPCQNDRLLHFPREAICIKHIIRHERPDVGVGHWKFEESWTFQDDLFCFVVKFSVSATKNWV